MTGGFRLRIAIHQIIVAEEANPRRKIGNAKMRAIYYDQRKRSETDREEGTSSAAPAGFFDGRPPLRSPSDPGQNQRPLAFSSGDPGRTGMTKKIAAPSEEMHQAALVQQEFRMIQQMNSRVPVSKA